MHFTMTRYQQGVRYESKMTYTDGDWKMWNLISTRDADLSKLCVDGPRSIERMRLPPANLGAVLSRCWHCQLDMATLRKTSQGSSLAEWAPGSASGYREVVNHGGNIPSRLSVCVLACGAGVSTNQFCVSFKLQ